MIRSILTILALSGLFIAMAIPAFAQRHGGGIRPGGPIRSGGTVSWNGSVDHDCIVNFHGGHSWVENVRGRTATNVAHSFTAPLPVNRPVIVHLVNVRGRGTIRITEQPSQGNNFTAKVRVHDPQPGRGDYHFRLEW